ncbi:MAG TPA: cytochrome b/b6 domain-containing protein [Streptosporangiales bacterium]
MSGRVGGVVVRFTWPVRWVHWATAVLFGVCALTAVALYVGPVAILVGHRYVVATVHTYAGLGLPVPALLGILARSVRADARSLERFGPHDWEWFKSADRRTGRLPIGKFNPGQKLNAAFVCGAVLLMLATGIILWLPGPWPVVYRTGATFVHDWLALAFVVVVLGHLRFAFRDPEARRGMRTGVVARSWARREHPGWAASVEAAEPPRRDQRDDERDEGHHAHAE